MVGVAALYVYSVLALLPLIPGWPHEDDDLLNDGVLLRKWVQGLVIDFGPFDVPVNLLHDLGITLNIPKGRCRDVTIDKLTVPHAKGSKGELDVDIDIVIGSIDCSVGIILHSFLGDYHLTASFDAMDTNVSLNAVLTADADGLPNALKIGTCSMQTTINDLTISGPLLPGFIERAIRTVINRFPGLLCTAAVPELVSESTALLSRLANFSRPYLTTAKPLLMQTPPDTKDIAALLWDGPFGLGLRSLFREVVHTDDMSLLNPTLDTVISDLGFKGEDGRVHLDQLIHLDHEPRVIVPAPFFNGTMQLETLVSHLILANISSFRSIFASVNSSHLGLGGAMAPTGNADVSVLVSFQGDSASGQIGGCPIRILEISKLAPLRISMYGTGLFGGNFSALVAIKQAEAASMKIDQFQTPSCFSKILSPLGPSPRAAVLELNAEIMQGEIAVQLVGLDDVSLEMQLLSAAKVIYPALNSSFGMIAAPLFSGVVSKVVRDQLNTAMTQFLSAPSVCPPSLVKDTEIVQVTWPGYCVLIACSAVMLFIISYWVMQILKSKFCTTMLAGGGGALEHMSLSDGVVAAEGVPQANLTRDDSYSNLSLHTTTSQRVEPLFQACGVSKTFNIFMILLIIATMVVFVVGCCTPGIHLSVIAVANNVQWTSPTISFLSIDNTIKGVYEAHSYPLLLLMVPFSIVWPFTKLFVMLSIWVRPWSHKCRGMALSTVDLVGKLSLTDSFLMLLLTGMLHLEWDGADVTEPSENVKVALFTFVDAEMYWFLLGTVLTMMLSHSMIIVHRATSAKFQDNSAESEADTSLSIGSILCEKYCTPSSRSWVKLGIPLLMVTATSLMIISLMTPCMTYRFLGVADVFEKVANRITDFQLSPIGIVQALTLQDHAGFGYLLFFFCMFVPVVAMVAMLFAWLVPMQNHRRNVAVTVCNALVVWSCSDILSLVIFGAVVGGQEYGIGQFIELLIYHSGVRPLCLSLYDYVGVECVDINLQFLPGFWFFASVSWLSSAFALSAMQFFRTASWKSCR